MEVHIIDNNRYLNPQKRTALKKQVKLILNNLNLTDKTEVCITFVGDDEMRDLNKTYRGINRTTDVLSFPQMDFNAAIAFPNIKPLLGDIIISFKTAKRHTRLYKTTMERETQKLIIHGILHLLGYDHKRKKDAEEMKKKEKELLSLIKPT